MERWSLLIENGSREEASFWSTSSPGNSRSGTRLGTKNTAGRSSFSNLAQLAITITNLLIIPTSKGDELDGVDGNKLDATTGEGRLQLGPAVAAR